MRARKVLAAGAVAVATAAMGAAGASPASAHPSPPGCDSNSLVLTLVKDRTLVRNGDTSNYTVSVANNVGSACDLTSVTVALTLPAADGTPTGKTVTLASNVDYPAGTAPVVLGTVPYTVALNPGVEDAVAQAKANGVLHDAPADHAAEITKTVGTTITQPHLSITESTTPTSGTSPLEVTHTYVVTNDSTTNVPIANPAVNDQSCSPAMLVGGDTNGNGLLDNGESWTYTCTQTLTAPGTIVSTATAIGTSTIDKLPVNAGPVSNSVDVSLPLVSTVLHIKLPGAHSKAARPNAPCVAVPKSLRVRAHERTVVRVHVTEAGKGVQRALVRITGPGFVKRATTNASGTATFRVRPKRTGTLIIQTSQCAGADRVTVRPARRVVSHRVPRNTG